MKTWAGYLAILLGETCNMLILFTNLRSFAVYFLYYRVVFPLIRNTAIVKCQHLMKIDACSSCGWPHIIIFWILLICYPVIYVALGLTKNLCTEA